MRTAIALLAFFLDGCSLIPGYSAYKTAASGVVDQTIIDRMEYNDKKALVIRALNCDISLGAYSRMPEGQVKQGVGMICGIAQSTPPIIVVGDQRSVRVIVPTVDLPGPDANDPEFLEGNP